MAFDLDATRKAVERLDARLRPIAKRQVWNLADLEKLKRGPAAVDEAGVRTEAEALMETVLSAYADGDSDLRASIRQLLDEASSFAWATGVADPPATLQGFRQGLLLVSAIDRGQDPRDAIVQVDHLCKAAKSAGIDTRAVLKEIAALSSDESETDMGSIRSILMRAR